jgi:hypothetical protein
MDTTLYILFLTFIVIIGIIIYYYINIPSKTPSKHYNPVIDPYWAHGGKHYSGLLY